MYIVAPQLLYPQLGEENTDPKETSGRCYSLTTAHKAFHVPTNNNNIY